MACSVQMLAHTTNYTSPCHTLNPNGLPQGAMHPSRVTDTRPGSQTQKCSCCHLTSHTHSAILPTAQRPFCLSVRVRERARLSSHCPHAHAIPWSRGEGERARARGSLTHACRGGRMRTGSTRRLASCTRWSGMRGSSANHCKLTKLFG